MAGAGDRAARRIRCRCAGSRPRSWGFRSVGVVPGRRPGTAALNVAPLGGAGGVGCLVSGWGPLGAGGYDLRLAPGGRRSIYPFKPRIRLEPGEELARFGQQRARLVGAALSFKPLGVLEPRDGEVKGN